MLKPKVIIETIWDGGVLSMIVMREGPQNGTKCCEKGERGKKNSIVPVQLGEQLKKKSESNFLNEKHIHH